MTKPTTTPASLLARITKASEQLADRRDETKAAQELRDRLVVEAMDAGISVRAVARACGFKANSRVMAILAASG